jgi:hypothetical protein
VRSRTASAAAGPDPLDAGSQPQPRPLAPLPSPLEAPGLQPVSPELAEYSPAVMEPADLAEPSPEIMKLTDSAELSPAVMDPDTAAALLAPEPGMAPLASSAEAAAAPDRGPKDASATSAADAARSAPESVAAPPAVLAPDLAADIEVDPHNNKFNVVLIADLTAAAAEARAPVEPDANCVAEGGTVCRSVARAKALLGDKVAGGRAARTCLLGFAYRHCADLHRRECEKAFGGAPETLTACFCAVADGNNAA